MSVLWITTLFHRRPWCPTTPIRGQKFITWGIIIVVIIQVCSRMKHCDINILKEITTCSSAFTHINNFKSCTLLVINKSETNFAPVLSIGAPTRLRCPVVRQVFIRFRVYDINLNKINKIIHRHHKPSEQLLEESLSPSSTWRFVFFPFGFSGVSASQLPIDINLTHISRKTFLITWMISAEARWLKFCWLPLSLSWRNCIHIISEV